MDECINYFELNVLINNHRMQIKSLKQGIPQQEFITPPLPHSKSKKETCNVKYMQSVFLFFGSWILEVLITKLLKLASQGSGTSEKEATEKYPGSLQGKLEDCLKTGIGRLRKNTWLQGRTLKNLVYFLFLGQPLPLKVPLPPPSPEMHLLLGFLKLCLTDQKQNQAYYPEAAI